MLRKGNALAAQSRTPPNTRDKVEVPAFGRDNTEALKAAAQNHLSRVSALADTEWKVTLTFWAAILVSGTTLLTLANGQRLDLAYMIYTNSASVLIAYLVASALFVFGFSVNQSQSISTERNRFLFYEAASLKSVGVPDTSLIGLRQTDGDRGPLQMVLRSQVRKSTVWAMKLATTTCSIAGIWAATVAICAYRASRFSFGIGKPGFGINWWAAANLLVSAIILIFWTRMTIHFFLRAKLQDR